MDPLAAQLQTLFHRPRIPLLALSVVVEELRGRGRALTPDAVLRMLEHGATGIRVLRLWTGPFRHLGLGGEGTPGSPAHARGVVREHRPRSPGPVLLVSRTQEPDDAGPLRPRVARSLVELAHALDEESHLARARWLQLQVEAHRLAA